MSISVLNTDAGLSGKTVINAEDTQTVTGAKTFDRDPNPPFAVSSGSAVVTNLDADKLDGLEATDFIKKDGSVAMTGDLDLGTVGQITFPAAQSASTGANVLDDYEEGEWTPVIGGSGGTSGQTYSTQIGRYVKIGKLVVATFNCVLTAEGTITGTVQIQGLPFTVDNVTSANDVFQIRFNGLATTWVNVVGITVVNTTTANVQGNTAAADGNVTGLTALDIDDSVQMTGTIIYRASA